MTAKNNLFYSNIFTSISIYVNRVKKQREINFRKRLRQYSRVWVRNLAISNFNKWRESAEGNVHSQKKIFNFSDSELSSFLTFVNR